MTIQDDRTPEQHVTHRRLVIATDKSMSGWGKATDGKSYAVWACTDDQFPHVMQWVQSRSEMIRVREGYGDYRPRGVGHCHIYAVSDSHPSLPSWMKSTKLTQSSGSVV